MKVTILMPAMRGVMRVPDQCATFRFSTAGLPKPARAQAVRDLHQRERTILPAGLEPIEPLVPLPDRPLQVDVIKRTLPGLAVVSGTLSGVRHAPRPKGAAGQGEGDLLLAVNVWGSSLARQRDTELSLWRRSFLDAKCCRPRHHAVHTRRLPWLPGGAWGGRSTPWPARRHADVLRSS